MAEFFSHLYSLVVTGFDWILNVESHLREFISEYGTLAYVLLFGIIFCETGLVVMPFLPGDSLLFAVGAVSAEQLLDISILYPSLLVAAILGDAVNYSVGRYAFDRVVARFGGRFIKPEHIAEAEAFFAKWGGWAIVLARFAPFLRTFVPFVAGGAHMNPRRFFFFNVLGGFVWITSFLWAGYFFGRLPFFQNNFKALMLGIIAVSVLPAVVGVLKARRASAKRVHGA
mgnify:CR=1 FL=1